MTNQTEREALKPCPFCGYDAMISGNPKHKVEPAINVHCSHCDVEGWWFYGKDCAARAYMHWNTRIVPPAAGSEALRTMVTVTAKYLDDLESEMLAGNADTPSQVAEKLRAALSSAQSETGGEVSDPQPETASNVRELQIRTDLRRLAIQQHERLVAGGCFQRSGKSCAVCHGEWDDGKPELHALTCTAVPFPPTESQTKIIDPIESVGLKGAQQQARHDHKSMLSTESPADQGPDTLGERK